MESVVMNKELGFLYALKKMNNQQLITKKKKGEIYYFNDKIARALSKRIKRLEKEQQHQNENNSQMQNPITNDDSNRVGVKALKQEDTKYNKNGVRGK